MRSTITKYFLANSLLAILLISAFAIYSLNLFHAEEDKEENENLGKCLSTFWELVRHEGKEFRIVNGKLLADNYAVNGNFELPDKVQSIFGGVATVFMGDLRVTTNVLNPDGNRAVGTKLKGPAYDAIFLNGKAYRGETLILDIPYLTAYDPIRDNKGKIIGALFVGIKKSEFLAHFNSLKMQLGLMLCALLVFFAACTYLLGKVTKKTEQMKEDHLSFLQTLIDTIPNPIFYKNTLGQYLGVNRAFESCVGMSREELVGKKVHELWTKEYADIYQQKDLALFDKRGEQSYESFVKYADGALHEVVFHKATFQKKDGALGGLVGVTFDITERRRNEEEKSRLDAQLHYSQLLGAVIIQLGHDLKTPLTPLLALLPLLRERASDAESKKAAEICCNSARHIGVLSDKALRFAKLSSDTATTNRDNIGLASSVDECIRDSAFLVAEKNLSCENLIGPEIVIQAVSEQIRELFANLISNAVRYSVCNGFIRIVAEQDKKSVTISVQDDGIGISPEHLENIFNEFYKTDESRHDLASLGLGLSICKRIVLNHQGRIWAESPGIDRGTKIMFTLPLLAV